MEYVKKNIQEITKLEKKLNKIDVTAFGGSFSRFCECMAQALIELNLNKPSKTLLAQKCASFGSVIGVDGQYLKKFAVQFVKSINCCKDYLLCDEKDKVNKEKLFIVYSSSLSRVIDIFDEHCITDYV